MVIAIEDQLTEVPLEMTTMPKAMAASLTVQESAPDGPGVDENGPPRQSKAQLTAIMMMLYASDAPPFY